MTCVGGTLAPSLLASLRLSPRFDYRIVGVNADPIRHAQTFCDVFHVVPRGDGADFCNRLLEIVEQERVEILVAGSDDEALAIATAHDEFAGLGCRPLVSSAECLSGISNKRTTYDRVQAAGLAAPRYEAVHTATDLMDAVHSFGYPDETVIVKPSVARGGRGLQVILGKNRPPGWLGSGLREFRWERLPMPDEADRFFDFGAELLVMPCLGAPAYDADVLAFGGEPVVIVRKRHNPAGIPFTGNTIISDKEVAGYCRQVARVMNLQALHDIDLMTDSDGSPVLLEVNPRPSGSMAASLVAGFPLVDWAVSRTLGIESNVFIPEHDIEVGAMVTPFVMQA